MALRQGVLEVTYSPVTSTLDGCAAKTPVYVVKVPAHRGAVKFFEKPEKGDGKPKLVLELKALGK